MAVVESAGFVGAENAGGSVGVVVSEVMVSEVVFPGVVVPGIVVPSVVVPGIVAPGIVVPGIVVPGVVSVTAFLIGVFVKDASAANAVKLIVINEHDIKVIRSVLYKCFSIKLPTVLLSIHFTL
jgi:hypothetical protein